MAEVQTDTGAGAATNADNVLAVAAIDFGSSLSGFAFSFVSHPHNIRMRRDWGCNVGIACSSKTPTCLLLKQNGEFEFGFEAQETMSALEEDQLDTVEFYERFKMHLYNVKVCLSKQKIVVI